VECQPVAAQVVRATKSKPIWGSALEGEGRSGGGIMIAQHHLCVYDDEDTEEGCPGHG